ncbi:MAG: hypothetical protein AAF961_13440, partial [Planctomycetota bacterium]
MASPFRFFRKHQKGFMAAAVVLCMVIFVFASALDPSGPSPRGGRGDSAPVAKWRGGSLDEGELRNLVRQRRVLNDFLGRLLAEGRRELGYQENPTVPVFLFPREAQEVSIERSVINTEVAAQLASDLGMSVSDEFINFYLREFGLRRIDQAGVVAVMQSVGSGNVAANEAIIFETLRKLLLAHYYQTAFADASATVLPQQRWRDW